VSPFTVIIRILLKTDAYKIKNVPKPRIYFAKDNLKNLGGPMSILNISWRRVRFLAIRFPLGQPPLAVPHKLDGA
jgi:hypothetical protein